MAVTDELDYPFFEKPATAEAAGSAVDIESNNKDDLFNFNSFFRTTYACHY